MVGISSSFVCRGQYWWVNHPVLFVMDNIGWYISQFCLSLTILAGISPVLSVVENIGWYISRLCLSWTILVGISPSFVFRGQLWLVYIGWYINCFGLFVMDSNGWFIFQFCPSWTIFVRILPSFVCHGQLWLEYIAVLSVADNIDWFIPPF